MALVWSTVYVVLRIELPVPLQYARVKTDFFVESHDGFYAVKKGELLVYFLYKLDYTTLPKHFASGIIALLLFSPTHNNRLGWKNFMSFLFIVKMMS